MCSAGTHTRRIKHHDSVDGRKYTERLAVTICGMRLVCCRRRRQNSIRSADFSHTMVCSRHTTAPCVARTHAAPRTSRHSTRSRTIHLERKRELLGRAYSISRFREQPPRRLNGEAAQRMGGALLQARSLFCRSAPHVECLDRWVDRTNSKPTYCFAPPDARAVKLGETWPFMIPDQFLFGRRDQMKLVLRGFFYSKPTRDRHKPPWHSWLLLPHLRVCAGGAHRFHRPRASGGLRATVPLRRPVATVPVATVPGAAGKPLRFVGKRAVRSLLF